jgi:hypothetical protein
MRNAVETIVLAEVRVRRQALCAHLTALWRPVRPRPGRFRAYL